MEKDFVLRVSLRSSPSSESVFYCQGEYSLSHNSAHISTVLHLKLCPTKAEPGLLGMYLHIPSISVLSQQEFLSDSQGNSCPYLAPMYHQQLSVSASSLNLEEGNIHYGSLNLYSKGFVLIKFYSIL